MKNNIRILRKEFKISQEKLARELRVTRQTIISIENNKYDPSLNLALKISKFFNKYVEEIFCEQED